MGLTEGGSTEITPMVNMPEKESKTGKGDPDIETKLNDLYGAVMVDNVDEVKEIMKIFDKRDHMQLLTGAKGTPLVIVATRHISFDCLKYFMDLHEELKDSFTVEDKIDQVDGFVANDKDGKNVNHFAAVQLKGRQAEIAVRIFNDHSDLFQDIINKPDAKGSTPLLTALKRNNEVIAKYLLQNGATFEKEINGQYPMKIAIVNGQLGTVEEMLNKVAPEKKSSLLTKINPFGDDGHTILYPATSSPNDCIFSFFIGKMNDETQKQMLQFEMGHNDFPKFVKRIISSGMNSAFETLMRNKTLAVGEKANTDDEGTPLIWAVQANQMEIVKSILKINVGKETVKIKDKNQKNVFHYAAEVDNGMLQHLKVRTPNL